MSTDEKSGAGQPPCKHESVSQESTKIICCHTVRLVNQPCQMPPGYLLSEENPLLVQVASLFLFVDKKKSILSDILSSIPNKVRPGINEKYGSFIITKKNFA